MSDERTGSYITVKVEGLRNGPHTLHYGPRDIADEVLELFAEHGLVTMTTTTPKVEPLRIDPSFSELLHKILDMNGVIVKALSSPVLVGPKVIS